MDLDTALDAMEENPSLRKACESTDSDVSHLTEVKQLDLHEDYDIQKQDSAGQELPVCMPRSALSEQRPKTVQEFVPSRPDALLTAIVNLGGVDNLEVASPTTAATAAAVDHEAWVKTHHKLPATNVSPRIDPIVNKTKKYVAPVREPADPLSPGPKFSPWGVKSPAKREQTPDASKARARSRSRGPTTVTNPGSLGEIIDTERRPLLTAPRSGLSPTKRTPRNTMSSNEYDAEGVEEKEGSSVEDVGSVDADSAGESDANALLRLLDSDIVSASAQRAAKARTEVLRLFREERMLRAEAIADAKACRQEAQRLSDIARKAAMYRARTERVMKAARDDAIAQAEAATDDVKRITDEHQALRDEVEDLSSKLAVARQHVSESADRVTQLECDLRAAFESSARTTALLQTQLDNATAERDALNSVAHAKEARIGELQARIREMELDPTIPNLRASVDMLEKALADARAAIAAKDDEIRALKARIADLNQDVLRLTCELGLARDNLDTLRCEFAALESSKDAYDRLAKAERTAREAVDAALADAEQRLADQAKLRLQLEGDILLAAQQRDQDREKLKEMGDLQARIAQYQTQQFRLEHRLEAAGAEVSTLTALLDNARTEQRDAQDTVWQERSLRVKSEAECAELRISMRTMGDKYRDEQADNERLRKQVATLEGKLDELTKKPKRRSAQVETAVAAVSADGGAPQPSSEVAGLTARLVTAEKNVEDLTRLIGKLRLLIDEKDQHLDTISRSLKAFQQEYEAEEANRIRREDDHHRLLLSMEQQMAVTQREADVAKAQLIQKIKALHEHDLSRELEALQVKYSMAGENLAAQERSARRRSEKIWNSTEAALRKTILALQRKCHAQQTKLAAIEAASNCELTSGPHATTATTAVAARRLQASTSPSSAGSRSPKSRAPLTSPYARDRTPRAAHARANTTGEGFYSSEQPFPKTADIDPPLLSPVAVGYVGSVVRACSKGRAGKFPEYKEVDPVAVVPDVDARALQSCAHVMFGAHGGCVCK